MNGIEIISTGYAKIEKTLDNAQLENARRLRREMTPHERQGFP